MEGPIKKINRHRFEGSSPVSAVHQESPELRSPDSLVSPHRRALLEVAQSGYLHPDYILPHREGQVFYTSNKKIDDIKTILERNGFRPTIRAIGKEAYAIYLPDKYAAAKDQVPPDDNWFLWESEVEKSEFSEAAAPVREKQSQPTAPQPDGKPVSPQKLEILKPQAMVVEPTPETRNAIDKKGLILSPIGLVEQAIGQYDGNKIDAAAFEALIKQARLQLDENYTGKNKQLT
ncbi:MAG: hypothetical protein A3J48_00505 [Candidatus Doudnabacteria bacterium RIFCSPHIGHO2_02_FULL_46_11]|uniref:Uncharacterized protein n=1 Tax=Candidatus Doudnabacteria bacterium RIFCSPHIGHO2_02_FULL_46_11 TaxID=1817832 RepID=A0A1F5P4Y5_9BACT|nr:MAG: hypothetical protein A3J48_00505 [Candidatus Doudnabacteria bacterium RIFCSPHIGHO2_02_FULL_46_11]